MNAFAQIACLLLVGLLALVPATAGQPLEIRRSGETLPTENKGDGLWHVQIDGEDYFLLKKSMVDTLTKRIAQKDAIIARHEAVLAAQDTLLAHYATFEEAANTHIDTLEALVVVADTLYRGYKGLYTDLKKLIGFSTFALHGGVGVANLPDDDVRLVGTLGLGYREWWAQAQIGRGYQGFTVGIRWPFGF